MGDDDRFFTPRASARAAGYASSGDEYSFGTPRAGSTRSDDDGSFRTARDDDFRTAREEDLEEGGAWYKDGPGPSESKAALGRPPLAASKLEYGYYGEDAGPEQQPDQREPEQELPDGVTDGDVEDIFSYARHNRVPDVERLLDRGIPLEVRDSHGNTILTIACQNGLKRMAKLALRRGANINSQNYRGNTPLHFACAYGYGDTLGAYLISKGADPTVRNDARLTCYEGIR